MAEASEKDYGDEFLAARIVLLRQKSGLSMEAFAEQLEVSQPTQSRIERAKRIPDARYLRALRKKFHADINDLLESMGGASRQATNITQNATGANAVVVATVKGGMKITQK